MPNLKAKGGATYICTTYIKFVLYCKTFCMHELRALRFQESQLVLLFYRVEMLHFADLQCVCICSAASAMRIFSVSSLQASGFLLFFFLLLLLCQTDMANWLQRLKSLDCLPCHKICAKVCDSLPQDKLGLIAIAAQIEMYLGSFGFWLWLWIWIWIWFWFSETGGHLESVYMLAPSTGAKSFASLNDTCTDCRVTL